MASTIAKMTLLEIIQDKVTNLPINPTKKSFREVLYPQLDQFDKLIQESSQDIDNQFKNRCKNLVEGIKTSIDKYYEGEPHSAYASLKKAMLGSNIKKYLNKDHYINNGTNFYRIRVKNGSFPLKKGGLFHIPFELRGIVRPQRFSIHGLPSLYLSNSVYGAWEEINRPDFNEIQAMRLVNSHTLRLLDLNTDIYNYRLHSKYYQRLSERHHLLYAIMVWPLVAACSVKVKNYNDHFKPEYIIPQLLLEWVNKDKLDGIKFSSTKIDFRTNRHKGHFYNVVLPVKDHRLEKGYCSQLSSKFEVTTVLPMQLRQFSSVAHRLSGQESISTNVNPDIQQLELIKGSYEPYSNTSFAILEHSLNDLKLEKIP